MQIMNLDTGECEQERWLNSIPPYVFTV
jgi:hypothetical protein